MTVSDAFGTLLMEISFAQGRLKIHITATEKQIKPPPPPTEKTCKANILGKRRLDE